MFPTKTGAASLGLRYSKLPGKLVVCIRVSTINVVPLVYFSIFQLSKDTFCSIENFNFVFMIKIVAIKLAYCQEAQYLGLIDELLLFSSAVTFYFFQPFTKFHL